MDFDHLNRGQLIKLIVFLMKEKEELTTQKQQLIGTIHSLLDTPGVWEDNPQGPDGYICTWCLQRNKHSDHCETHDAHKLLRDIE